MTPEFIAPPPSGKLREAYKVIFTKEAKQFMTELYLHFEIKINKLYSMREMRKEQIKNGTYDLRFVSDPNAADKNWRVASVPARLENRHLDVGDVSPVNVEHLISALNAHVQGIQVDFDDAHCPTWKNQIEGLYNVYQIVHNLLPGVPSIEKAPLLMLRPRAWNMMENHIWINGKPIPGPIMDFALLVFHNADVLVKHECGPFFYLSKIEGSNEAQLWNEIFVWTQQKLDIPYGTIKACVLIENILSSFEMSEILYELRDHAIGLNCGIWDYSASIIAKFGFDKRFILPDRNKYVNMEQQFLKRYLQLVIRVCHARGAHATGGMYAKIVSSSGDNMTKFYETQKALRAKQAEILEGIDGFMVYDVNLVPHMNQMWKTECGDQSNQIFKQHSYLEIRSEDLLQIPKGGVTIEGLVHNIRISMLFIYNWLEGHGHFIHENSVEDSATAEISRSQVWQWTKHAVSIEHRLNQKVTYRLVTKLTLDFLKTKEKEFTSLSQRAKIKDAAMILLEIISCDQFSDFITTYLNEHPVFRVYHDLGEHSIKHKI